MENERKKKHIVSIIMPVHNGASTLERTLESLLGQNFKPDEVVIIDDASSDNSSQIIKKYLDDKIACRLFRNNAQQGLAKTYNLGIKESGGDLIVTMHQDVILQKGALEKIIQPFSNPEVVATSHVVDHPMEIWNQYNFWQKCFFSRLVGKKFSGIDGKFDCFRKKALEKVGMFNETNFHTAGEDGDLIAKLKNTGKIVLTDAEIIHLHRSDKNFSWKDIIYKQKQYSEAQGALFGLGRIKDPKNIIRSFFREILLIGLLIPHIWMLSIFLIAVYSFWYTKEVYFKEFKNPRITVLPFFNVGLLFFSIFYSCKGFILKKQVVSK